MQHYVRIDADGDQCFGTTDAGELPDGATIVPRAPEAFERWDFGASAFVHDAEGYADWLAGPAHIAAMHARKAVEAHLIAAGTIAPSFLIVREAALRGVTAEELAVIVLGKVAGAEALELDRQAASLPLGEQE